MIADNRAKQPRTKQQRSKAANLRFATPSQPTTIGTDIRAALESAGHQGRLTGKCRGYLGLLNRPQRHDSEAITDTLADLLRFESSQSILRKQTLPVSREWLAEIVGQALQNDADSRPVQVSGNSGSLPIVSDVGTRLIAAIEREGKYKITCGHCRNYFIGLNSQATHDADRIIDDMQHELKVPEHLRHANNMTDLREARQVWLRAIVKSIIAEDGPNG